LIKTKFAPLVRADSIFWNAGGINVDLRLLGISISAENFRSVIIGGVAFATPNEVGDQAPAGTVFPLHDKVENKWLSWAPSIAITNATVTVPVTGPISPLHINE
jgi:paraquat-inducible protein B